MHVGVVEEDTFQSLQDLVAREQRERESVCDQNPQLWTLGFRR